MTTATWPVRFFGSSGTEVLDFTLVASATKGWVCMSSAGSSVGSALTKDRCRRVAHQVVMAVAGRHGVRPQ